MHGFTVHDIGSLIIQIEIQLWVYYDRTIWCCPWVSSWLGNKIELHIYSITVRKRSCGKVMVLHLFVVPFTEGVWIWVQWCLWESWGSTPRGHTPGHTHSLNSHSPTPIRSTLRWYASYWNVFFYL